MKGFFALVLWVGFWMFTISKCSAESVIVRWVKNPEPDIIEYRVYRVDSGVPVQIASTSATSVNVEADVGDLVAVSAFNGFLEGELSVPTRIPEKAPPAMVKVKLWRTDNLLDKRPVAEFYFERKNKEFIFLTVETP